MDGFFPQGIWMLIAIAALIIFNRSAKRLAAVMEDANDIGDKQNDVIENHADATEGVGDSIQGIRRMLDEVLTSLKKDDDAKRLQARVDAAKGILLRNWPEGRRGDWIVQVSGESAFSEPNDSSAEIRLFYPEQEPTITITVSMFDPVLVVGADGNCALLRLLGNHNEEAHDYDWGCSASIDAYQAEEVLAKIGEFLSENPRGFPAEEDAVEELGEETLVEERVIERGPGGIL